MNWLDFAFDCLQFVIEQAIRFYVVYFILLIGTPPGGNGQ